LNGAPGNMKQLTIAAALTVVATILCSAPAFALDLSGIDHFAINVRDLQKSADWYDKVFGFKTLHKWDNAWMIGRGNIKIGLFIFPNAKPLPDINSNFVIRKIAFLIDADKFADALTELRYNGADLSETEDTGIAYSVFFHDPDGYLLEITTFHMNGDPPGLPKSPGK
jgi:catechol 2,3-dioxygenase-like lactoylglutathione lyase family enzyme